MSPSVTLIRGLRKRRRSILRPAWGCASPASARKNPSRCIALDFAAADDRCRRQAARAVALSCMLEDLQGGAWGNRAAIDALGDAHDRFRRRGLARKGRCRVSLRRAVARYARGRRPHESSLHRRRHRGSRDPRPAAPRPWPRRGAGARARERAQPCRPEGPWRRVLGQRPARQAETDRDGLGSRRHR